MNVQVYIYIVRFYRYSCIYTYNHISRCFILRYGDFFASQGTIAHPLQALLEAIHPGLQVVMIIFFS